MRGNFTKTKEFLAVAFNITNVEVLARIKNLWSKEQKTKYKSYLGRNEVDTRSITSDQLGGEITLFDPRCMKESLGRISIRTPMGLYYDQLRGTLLVGTDHWITAISSGTIKATLNSPFFNCVHWLSGTYDGNLLIAATGIDALLKIDLNCPEKLLSSWFATENGYDLMPSGKRRVVDKKISHQGIEYCTVQHTTHINSAIEYQPDLILATLFHQGILLKIDLRTGYSQPILSGMKNPHSIRETSFGYIVSDTNGKRVVKLNKELYQIGELTGDFDWIQDTIELEDGNFIVADVNHGRLVLVDSQGNMLSQHIYGADNKKVGSMLTLDRQEAENIFGSRMTLRGSAYQL